MAETPKASQQSSESRIKIPHTYIIIFFCIILAAVATYLIPAGVYDKVKDPHTGRTIVNAASYHLVKASPVGIFDIFLAFPKGFQAASPIIAFILMVGGAFGIIEATGTLQAAVYRTVGFFEKREKLLIPAFMVLFSIGGAVFGMAEETIIFVPIGIAIARSMGFDNLTGTAMISMGAAAGFTAGMMNPFSVGVAHALAELPMFSGMWYRFIVYAGLMGSGIWYTMRYANKVKADPTYSYVHHVEGIHDSGMKLNGIEEFNFSHKMVLLVIVIGFAGILWGVTKNDWGIPNISGAFVAIGVVSGLVGRLGFNSIPKEFIKGAQSLIFGAMVVGLARGIMVTLEQGKIVDTIIYSMAGLVSGMPQMVAAEGMMIGQCLLNFLIPSSTGMAATTLPILIPLGDVIGVTRQTTVLAFQFGDGITNSITPTSGALMGYLAVARIPYESWVKFVGPLMGIWIVLGAIFTAIAVTIKYGPF
jgi:uncharacterized ion transporter superfamily protein YfcC